MVDFTKVYIDNIMDRQSDISSMSPNDKVQFLRKLWELIDNEKPQCREINTDGMCGYDYQANRTMFNLRCVQCELDGVINYIRNRCDNITLLELQEARNRRDRENNGELSTLQQIINNMTTPSYDNNITYDTPVPPAPRVEPQVNNEVSVNITLPQPAERLTMEFNLESLEELLGS